jgi:hypothetical protein
MINGLSRRSLLKWASVSLPVGWNEFRRRALGAGLVDKDDSPNRDLITDSFPTQPPELAREMVTVSHFDLKHVKELVEERP